MFAYAPAPRRRAILALPSGRFLLGAITADAAARTVFPNPPASPNAGHNMATFDSILAAAGSGQMSPAYLPGTGDCANATLGPRAILTKGPGMAGGLLLKIGAASGNPIVLAVGAAATIAGIVFSVIFGHHAKAVAKERSILCAAVPAANQTVLVVDESVASGQFTPQNGIDALNATLAGFAQAVASIQHGADPTAKGECNAACVMLSQLRAIVARKISQYQDLQAAAAAAAAAPIPGVPGAITQAITGGKVSSLLPLAAAGLVLFLILQEV
jgi:hypothetical protein